MNMDRLLQGIFLGFIIAIAGLFTLVTADDPVTQTALIFVDDDGGADYISIQAAVENASVRDTIFVYNGTYNEIITIDKSLNITGENAVDTIIEGGGGQYVITVAADDVYISGFTITNSSSLGLAAGVYVQGDNFTIDRCVGHDNYVSVYVQETNDVFITHCTFMDDSSSAIYVSNVERMNVYACIFNASDVGISVGGSNNIFISNCAFYAHTQYGISLNASTLVTLEHNALNNNECALQLFDTDNCIITACELRENTEGIRSQSVVMPSYENSIYRNNFINNIDQAFDTGANLWDDGAVGNYWSDFDEPSEGAWDNNTDGVIDKIYPIPGDDNKDHYPLGNPMDLYPPETEVVISGPLGDDGWYAGSASVILNSFDNDSMVNHTYYHVDDGMWQEYIAPFILSSEGIHVLAFYSIDTNENPEAIEQCMVKIDVESPNITCFLEPAMPEGNDDWYIGNVEVTLMASDTASGVRNIRYKIDEDTWKDYTGYFLLTMEGNHTFSYLATDKAGHQTTHFRAIKLDKFGPAVTITAPTAAYIRGTISVNWTAYDTVDTSLNRSISLYLLQDNESTAIAMDLNNTGTYTWNTQSFADGRYRLHIVATDEARNEGSNTSHSFILDNMAPTVIIDQPRGGEVLGGDYEILEIFWNASDSIDANLDGTIWIAYSSDTGETWINIREAIPNRGKDTYNVSGWENGNYILRINATDDAGNTGYDFSANFTIDKSAPSVSITRPDPGYLYINMFDRDIIPPIPIALIPLPLDISTVIIGKVLVTVSASDEFSDISRIEIQAGDTTQVFYDTPYRFEWNPTDGMGQCRIVVIAEDLAGNTATDEMNGIFCINY